MRTYFATAAAACVMTAATSASASVIIDDWAGEFSPASTDVTSMSQTFTDPDTSLSTTMTVSVVSGDNLDVRTHMGIDTTDDSGANITPGESLSFQWDQDVDLTQVNLFQGKDEELMVSSDAFDDFVALGNTITIDELIPANTLVTFTGGDGTNTADGEEADYKFDGATFDVVPEPASLALLGLGGLAMLGRRRQRLA